MAKKRKLSAKQKSALAKGRAKRAAKVGKKAHKRKAPKRRVAKKRAAKRVARSSAGKNVTQLRSTSRAHQMTAGGRSRAAINRKNRSRGKANKFKGYSKNPISLNGVKMIGRGLLMPAAIGAVGAVAINSAISYLPIPAQYKSGYTGVITKTVSIVAVGWVASKVVKKQTADALVIGALTVLFYDVARNLVGQMLPSVRLGDMDMYSAGMIEGVGEYQSTMGGVEGMDEYMTAGMGEYDMAGNGDNY